MSTSDEAVGNDNLVTISSLGVVASSSMITVASSLFMVVVSNDETGLIVDEDGDELVVDVVVSGSDSSDSCLSA